MAQPLMEATAEVRERIAAAARALFADRGYHSTTVDAIAEQAGIARRTFFRYFRSKDEAIFPNHERMTQSVACYLRSEADASAVEVVCAGARMIFLAYMEEPGVSIERYRVAHSVQALRNREIASVNQYIRMFSRYLRERFGDSAGAELHADVIAGAVVAAHNQVLRAWLRSGGDHDPLPDLDAAFAWVVQTFEGEREVWQAGEAAATGERENAVAEDSGPEHARTKAAQPGDDRHHEEGSGQENDLETADAGR